MRVTNWLNSKYGPELDAKAHEKIREIKHIENEIPGVIIIHDITDSTVVYMSNRGLRILGITLDEVRDLGVEYYQRFFNPEDAKDYVPKILGLLERNNNDDMVSFFQQVRPSEDHEWTWYSSCTRIFLRDCQDKPVLTITIAVPIDPQHYFVPKVERLLKENNFLRHNQHIFAALTKREKEILRLMASGSNSNEIADKLHISESTANTHRRNIRSKINAQSNYDVTMFAQAFDLI